MGCSIEAMRMLKDGASFKPHQCGGLATMMLHRAFSTMVDMADLLPGINDRVVTDAPMMIKLTSLEFANSTIFCAGSCVMIT